MRLATKFSLADLSRRHRRVEGLNLSLESGLVAIREVDPVGLQLLQQFLARPVTDTLGGVAGLLGELMVSLSKTRMGLLEQVAYNFARTHGGDRRRFEARGEGLFVQNLCKYNIFVRLTGRYFDMARNTSRHERKHVDAISDSQREFHFINRCQRITAPQLSGGSSRQGLARIIAHMRICPTASIANPPAGDSAAVASLGRK